MYINRVFTIFHWVITELLFKERFLSTQSQEPVCIGFPNQDLSWFSDRANKLSLSPRALIIVAHTKLLCFAALSQRDDAWGFTLLHSHLLPSLTSTFSLKAVLAATKKTSANARFSNANGVLLISGNTTSLRVVIRAYSYWYQCWNFGCSFVNIRGAFRITKR